MIDPKLSIIIPVFNEEKEIVLCLKSLAKQTYKNLEIIVVDDGSVDKTTEIISKFQVPNSKLILLKQKHEGPGEARNLGVKHAGGDILVFVDADMTFDRNFLKHLVKPIVIGKAKGTFSKQEYVSNWNNVWARCWNINEGWENKRRHSKDYPDKQKVFRAILKSEFDKVGGFTPGGYTDDYSLSEKLGYKAITVNGSIFYHKNPDTLIEVYKHAKWVGKRDYKLGRIGLFVALFRSSLPVSILIGLVKAAVNFQPPFIIFKIIYDVGLFVGILELLITGKAAK